MQTLSMKCRCNRFTQLSVISAIFAIFCFSAMPSFGQVRVIEVLADKDSHFKMAGMSHPEITVKAGEPLLLRINARKGKTMNRDGTVHGFTLLRAKDHHKVTGWDLEIKTGDAGVFFDRSG